MKLLLAPPRSNISGATKLIANLFYGDNVAAVRTVYRKLETDFGPEWFFNKKVTALKNLQMARIRASIEKYIKRSDVLVTSETALFKDGDLAYVVVPNGETILANNVLNVDEFQYTGWPQAERILLHYAKFARDHHLKVYADIVPAATDLLNS